MEYDVFISYSRRDYLDENGDVIPGNIISKLKDVLKENGITYWIDEDGINSGDEFARLIIRSIKDSKVLLFVSTENSNNSAWTRKEIASAIAYKKKIIPFKCDDTPFNDSLLLYLADLDFISYKQQGSRALKRLVTSISNYLNSIKPVEEVALAEVETKPVPKPEPKPEVKPEVKPVPKPKKESPVAEVPKNKAKTRNILLITLISLALIGAAVMVYLNVNSDKQNSGNIVDNIENTEVKAEQKSEPVAIKNADVKTEAKTEVKTEVKAEDKTAAPTKQESKPVVKKEVKDATIDVKGVKFDMIAVKGNGKVGDFCIGKYEVTQQLWKAVMGTSVQQQRDKLDPSFKLRGEGDNLPMYYVSWDDCQEFIKKLNSLTGKRFRLPSEAEWEYAAKGGANGGGALSGWNENNSNGSTHAVGGKEPNALGLYDMAGNVSEWCKDKKGYEHVVKGGGWASTEDNCKATSRSYLDEMIRSDETGFRLVMD